MTTTPLKQKTNNMFWTNFKLCLKQNKKILIVISILQLLGLPLMAVILTDVALEPDDSEFTSQGFFLLISIFCLLVSIICGIIIAVNNFSYLHKKSQVDMIYSLPIKRKYKFMSDFFSGLAVYLVPYIIACILSIGILLASGVCINDMAELLDDRNFLRLLLQGEFALLLIMTLLYTLTVFVLNCCGTLFESIMNIFIINALIPGVIAVVAAMFFARLYGVSVFDTILPVLGYTSPVGAVIYLCYLLNTDAFVYSDAFGCISAGVYGKWAAFFLLFTAAVFLLSLFLYLKRKAEDVSKPYVYKQLYHFVITAILMAISLIARYDITTIVPVIVFSLIVYLIFEVITNRGFKKIYKSLIRYAVTMVSIFVVCIIAVGTNGFGAESKVPSASSVKSVNVDYQGFDRSVVLGYGLYYYDYQKSDRVYDQEEIIKKVIEVQEDALDTYYSGEFQYSFFDGYNYYSDSYDPGTYDDGTPKEDYPQYEIEIIYNLKNGSKIKRTYTLTYEQISKLFILDSTPQMSAFIEKNLMNSIRYEEYYNDKKRVLYSVYISSLLNVTSNEYSIKLSQAKELCKAYAEDYSNMTTDQMLTENIYCYINSEYPVRESFKNTIACIKKYNMTVPDILKSDFDYSTEMAVMYPPEALKCWGADVITASFGATYLEQSKGRMLNYEQFASIIKMKMLRAPYYEESDCYCVKYNGEIYIIPSDFTDEAENLYSKLSENEFIVSKELLIEDLRYGDNIDINDIIKKYGMEYSPELYNELTLLQEMACKYYDEYESFEDYYDTYYGYYDMSIYNSEKAKWDSWLNFYKFYGYVSLDSYLEIHPNEDKNEVSEEWQNYISVFNELNQQQK